MLAELTKAELADIVGVSAAAIGQYEAGITAPRPDLLPALARALKTPVEFFATGRPLGRLDAANAHFRSLRSTRAKDRAKAATHAEQIWELTHALEKRIRLPEPNLPRILEGTSPVEAARFLRKEWRVDRGPFAHLAATIESNGVIVSLIPMTNDAITRVSAYSTDALGRPLIIVTPERTKSVFRYRFTCAHELGHLLLHSNALPGDRQQEREADEFAAELLTPREQIEPLLPRTLRLAVLEQLSHTWGVSVESLVRRMENYASSPNCPCDAPTSGSTTWPSSAATNRYPPTKAKCPPCCAKHSPSPNTTDKPNANSPASSAGPSATSTKCSAMTIRAQNCTSCARRRQAQAGRSMSNQRHTRSRSTNRDVTEQVKTHSGHFECWRIDEARRQDHPRRPRQYATERPGP